MADEDEEKEEKKKKFKEEEGLLGLEEEQFSAYCGALHQCMGGCRCWLLHIPHKQQAFYFY